MRKHWSQNVGKGSQHRRVTGRILESGNRVGYSSGVLERVLRALAIAFWVYVVAGFGLLVTLAFASPWVIGRGRVEAFTAELESFDFKWWLVAVSLLVWIVPIVLVVAYRNAKRAGLEAERVKAYVREMLEGRSFPVIVDVDTEVPVKLAPLDVEFRVDAKVNIEDRIQIEGTVPLVTDLPIDTEISTSVFGIGTVKIPIKGKIPLNITIPLRTTMFVKATGIPIRLEEKAHVALPAMDVPIKSRIDARIDILKTIDTVGKT